jgi:hypothetical protein
VSDDAMVFATADEAIAAAHKRLLEECEVWFKDAGADEEQIVRVRKLFEQVLHDTQASAKAMLECRAMFIQ